MSRCSRSAVIVEETSTYYSCFRALLSGQSIKSTILPKSSSPFRAYLEIEQLMWCDWLTPWLLLGKSLLRLEPFKGQSQCISGLQSKGFPIDPLWTLSFIFSTAIHFPQSFVFHFLLRCLLVLEKCYACSLFIISLHLCLAELSNKEVI